MTPEEILRLLVAVPTPSAMSNVPLLDWVSLFLEEHRWSCRLLRYAGPEGVAKANLIARPRGIGADETIGLAFVCHTDTVPFAAEWVDALALRRSPDSVTLHGCGACDVKGSLACFLAALSGIGLQSVRPDAALILTADEEIGCKGMEQLLASTHLRICSAIVSEPTSLRAGVAGKGYGLARVTIEGAEAHSAFPSIGVSAIQHAARFLYRLEGQIDAIAGSIDMLFDPPRTTVNVGVIEGGTAKNVVAGVCTFLVEWRPIPGDDPSAMPAMLEQIADAVRMEEPRVRIRVEALRAEAGFAPKSAGALQAKLTEILGPRRAPMGISFGSEASRLARVADEVIVIGPGDMQTAHSAGECVPMAELEEWTHTLRVLLASN